MTAIAELEIADRPNRKLDKVIALAIGRDDGTAPAYTKRFEAAMTLLFKTCSWEACGDAYNAKDAWYSARVVALQISIEQPRRGWGDTSNCTLHRCPEGARGFG